MRNPPKAKLRARYNYRLGGWTQDHLGSRRILQPCKHCGEPAFSTKPYASCIPCTHRLARERALAYKDILRKAGVLKGPQPKIPPSTYKLAQTRAIAAVSVAKMQGKLPYLRGAIVCVDCQKKPAQVYDHRDYSKPLEVDPVCMLCNVRRGPALWHGSNAAVTA